MSLPTVALLHVHPPMQQGLASHPGSASRLVLVLRPDGVLVRVGQLCDIVAWEREEVGVSVALRCIGRCEIKGEHVQGCTLSQARSHESSPLLFVHVSTGRNFEDDRKAIADLAAPGGRSPSIPSPLLHRCPPGRLTAPVRRSVFLWRPLFFL